MTPRIRFEFSVELPGTPEQVWQAIATVCRTDVVVHAHRRRRARRRRVHHAHGRRRRARRDQRMGTAPPPGRRRARLGGARRPCRRRGHTTRHGVPRRNRLWRLVRAARGLQRVRHRRRVGARVLRGRRALLEADVRSPAPLPQPLPRTAGVARRHRGGGQGIARRRPGDDARQLGGSAAGDRIEIHGATGRGREALRHGDARPSHRCETPASSRCTRSRPARAPPTPECAGTCSVDDAAAVPRSDSGCGHSGSTGSRPPSTEPPDAAAEQERGDLWRRWADRQRRRPRLRPRGARSTSSGARQDGSTRSRAIRAEGGAAETAQLDALDEAAVDAHADLFAERFGSVDVSLCVIAAGEVFFTPLAE